MTLPELDVEWLRCWRLLQSGDVIVVPQSDHWLSDRIAGISEQSLSRQFLYENRDRFASGEASTNNAEFESWRFDRFMHDANRHDVVR